VYVAVPDGDGWLAEVRAVETSAADRGRVVVTSGLASGDRVIVLGQHRVSDGDRVTLVEDSGAQTVGTAEVSE
jgi:multidrug efflux pump subunit AcrA (membrane-fusion protein)